MKNIKIILVLIMYILISCKDKNEKKSIILDSSKIEIKSKILKTNFVILVSPSSLKLEKLKKKIGDNFYTIADDINFYNANAIKFLDSLKIKYEIADENDVYSYVNNKNIEVKILNTNEANWYGIFYNNNSKTHKIANLIDFKSEHNKFFKVRNDKSSISNESTLENLNSKMLQNYNVVRNLKGDLNNDKLIDELYVYEPKIKSLKDFPVVVLINIGNNIYLEYQNSNIILPINSNCPSDGFQDLVIKNNYFTIEQNICGGWFFADQYTTFKYDLKTNKILLHKQSKSLTDRKDPDKEIPNEVLSVKDFGNVEFQNYNLKGYVLEYC